MSSPLHVVDVVSPGYNSVLQSCRRASQCEILVTRVTLGCCGYKRQGLLEIYWKDIDVQQRCIYIPRTQTTCRNRSDPSFEKSTGLFEKYGTLWNIGFWTFPRIFKKPINKDHIVSIYLEFNMVPIRNKWYLASYWYDHHKPPLTHHDPTRSSGFRLNPLLLKDVCLGNPGSNSI